MKAFFLSILIITILSSCSLTKNSNTALQSIQYLCDRELTLSVTFVKSQKADDNKAIIRGFGDHPLELPSVVVASGFLYANAKYSLRGKGEDATWTVGRMAPVKCNLRP